MRTYLSDSETHTAASTATIVATFLILAIRLADTHAIHAFGVHTRAATSTTPVLTALLAKAIRLTDALVIHTSVSATAASTTATAAVAAALFPIAAGLTDALVIYTRVIAFAASTTAAAAVVAALFPVTLGLAYALVLDAKRVGIVAHAAISTTPIVTALLIHAGRKDSGIERRTVHVVGNPVVIVIFVQTISETRSVRVGKVFVDLAVAVIVDVVTDLSRCFLSLTS